MKYKISKGITILTKKIEKVLKKIYHKIPISNKVKVVSKNVFFTVFGGFMKNTPSYIIWKQTKVKIKKNQSAKSISSEKFNSINLEKSIAVQLHLYYLDLIDEFVKYLSNIPYKFDLYISVVDDSKNEEINTKTKKINNMEKVVIKKVENRGRDVAPFIVDFSKELVKYDYVCHIHSKKSLYTGSEQSTWRTYLLNGLFGNEQHIKNIFYLFETNPDVGLIYPETFPGLPYLGHTWLSNDESKRQLLEKLGYVDVQTDKFIDFPMGTMFWGRVKAINKFFKVGIKTNDFPKENGQTDGTIAHAFERCLGTVNRVEGYSTITYNEENESFNFGEGNKNFYQYWVKSKEQIIELADNFNVISFDIFDTLLMRNIFEPDNIFKIVELRCIREDINISFVKYRKKAEKILRIKKEKGDFSLDDIYYELENITNLSREKCDIIKKIEVETDMEFIIPRNEVIDVLKTIKKRKNKKVILVSDMYYSSEIITEMLKRNNIIEYDELWISSEKQARKDDGTMWDLITKKYESSKIIHIGDNEESDIQVPSERNIFTYHIMSAKDLFQLSNVGKKLKVTPKTVVDSVMLGVVVGKYYSNPFSINECKFENKINSMYDFGYMIIGPIVCDFIIWLSQQVKKQSINNVLMLAREGYLLNDVFNILKDNCNKLQDVNSKYIYASRRSALVASIKNEKDIKEALCKFYEGTLKDLLLNRFGISELSDIEDVNVVLPGDSHKVYQLISSKIDEIINNSEQERKTYKEYLDENISDSNAIVDIGYSGSIQYYLSKIVSTTFVGLYFATDSKELALKIPNNKMIGRYIEKDEIQPASPSYIHRYSLLLEAVLTSMDNQFCGFNKDGNPIFNKNEVMAIDKKDISSIHEGAKDFARKLFGYIGEDIIDVYIDTELSEKLIKSVVESNILSENIKNKLVLEDQFCKSGTINIFGKLINYKDK